MLSTSRYLLRRLLVVAIFFSGCFLISNQVQAVSLITGAGSGGGPHVRSFTTSGTVETNPNKLMAYGTDYRGGVRVATGDIDNDNIDEIITGTGENGGPHLRVFEKDGTQRGIDFFPFDSSFRGGMDVASGDFDGDGKEDIAVSQFSNGQAWVKVYRYNTTKDVLFEQNVFGTPECGATVAMGQLDSDANKELIVGAGNGCSSQIVAYDYQANDTAGTKKSISFYAYDTAIKAGVDVSAGDVDGDGKDEIAASRLKDSLPYIYVFRYNTDHTQLASFKAYGDFQIGANVEMADIDSDGLAEVVTGAGPGGGPQLRAFEYDGTAISALNKAFAYDSGFRGGVDVAAYNPNGSRRDLSDLATYANAYKEYTNEDLENLKRFDIVAIDPYDVPDASFVTELKAAGVIVLAYIDIGEAEIYRSYWDSLDQSLVLQANPDWEGCYYADVNNPAWHNVLLNTEIPYLFEWGDYDGLMMDMLDTVDVLPELKPGMIELVRKIHERYPDLLLVPNRGFSVLPEISSHIDAVKYEGMCATYDFDTQSYYYEDDDNEMAILTSVLEDHNVPVLALDHVDTSTAAGEVMARACYDKARQREQETGFNFIWYANAVTQDLPVWDWLPFSE